MRWYKKLLVWGFCQNYWVWFHAIAAGILTRILQSILSNSWAIVIIVAIMAFAWEAIEYQFETNRNPADVYGTRERWAYDSLGDIIIAIIVAIMIVV